MATSERSGGKIKQPVVLTDLQGKGLVRKEAFLLKAFWLLCGYKVTGPPAAKSGSTICKTALYSIEIASFLAMTRGKRLKLPKQLTAQVPVAAVAANKNNNAFFKFLRQFNSGR